ncbi:hypothetical protein FACS1894132_11740 [Clostridia bacterium]|nr:hypothetical protein FACS1894132_11740 [Clostridia bacterium]
MQKISNKIIALLTSIAFFVCSYAGLGKIAFEDLHISADETSSDILYGDVNGDGNIDVFDLAIHKQHILENSTTDTKIYDLNGNGVVNSVDTGDLSAYLLKVTNNFGATLRDSLESVDREIIYPYGDIETGLTVEMFNEVQNLVRDIPTVDGLISTLSDYVKNEITLEYYYGSRKGAIGTFEQKSGNDVDKTSLLIALLSLINVEAKYSINRIIMTENQILDLAKNHKIETALAILRSQGRDVDKENNGKYSMYWICSDIETANLPYEHIEIATATSIYDFTFSNNPIGLKSDVVSFNLDGKIISYSLVDLYAENITIVFESVANDEYGLTDAECETFKLPYLQPKITIWGEENYSDTLYLSNQSIPFNIEYITNSASIATKLQERQLIAGNTYGIVIDSGNIGTSYIASISNRISETSEALKVNNIFESDVTADWLTLTGSLYFAQLDMQAKYIADESEVYAYRGLSFGIIGVEKNPSEASSVAVSIDVPQNYMGAIDINGENNSNLTNKFQTSYSILSSYFEGSIIEQMLGVEGISAAKVLEVANPEDIVMIYRDNFDEEIKNITIYANATDNANARASLRNLVVTNGCIATISRNQVTVNQWVGNGAIVYNPDTGLSSDVLYFNSSFSNGGSGTQFFKIDYLISMIIASGGISWSMVQMLAIAGGFIANPILAGIAIGAIIAGFAAAASYYFEEMDLCITAQSGGPDAQWAKEQLNKNAKRDVVLGIIFATAGQIARPLVNFALSTTFAKKVGETVTNKFIKNGGNILNADKKVNELGDAFFGSNNSTGKNTATEFITKFKNFEDIPNDVLILIKKSGFTPDEFLELLKTSPDKLSKNAKDAIIEIRNTFANPTNDTVMIKAIPEADYNNYIGGEYYDTVQGFTAPKEYANNFKNAKDYIDGLALDYNGSSFNPDKSIYVIEYKTSEPSKFFTPYSSDFGGTTDLPAPFTGNGFTASTNKSLIPEYHVNGTGQNGAHVTHGSTIYAVTPSGQKTAVARFDATKDNSKGGQGIFVEMKGETQ